MNRTAAREAPWLGVARFRRPLPAAAPAARTRACAAASSAPRGAARRPLQPMSKQPRGAQAARWGAAAPRQAPPAAPCSEAGGKRCVMRRAAERRQVQSLGKANRRVNLCFVPRAPRRECIHTQRASQSAALAQCWPRPRVTHRLQPLCTQEKQRKSKMRHRTSAARCHHASQRRRAWTSAPASSAS